MKKTHKYAIGATVAGLILFLVLSNFRLIKLPTVNAPTVNAPKEPEANTTKYLPVKQEDNEQSSILDNDQSGWKTYVNHQAKFKIDFPEELDIIEDFTESELRKSTVSKKVEPNYDEIIKYDTIIQGRVMFCSQKVPLTQNYCYQGFQILYGIPMGDGWGGGCGEQYRKEMQFVGESQSVCDTQKGISQLYAEHPNYMSEVNLRLNFGDGFERQSGLTMLKSFEFVEDTYN